MKHFDEKIAKFISWCEENNYPLYTPKVFLIYQMENEGIEDLTEQEEYYLKVLYEVRTQKMWMTGAIKQDAAKLSLMNDCGWSEKSKIENTQNVEYVQFNTEGLLTINTVAGKYDNQSLENEAIGKLIESRNKGDIEEEPVEIKYND